MSRFPTFRKIFTSAKTKSGQAYFLFPRVSRVQRVWVESLLQILASATERQLPLPPVLSTLVEQMAPTHWTLKVQALITQLEAGTELQTALARVPGLVPDETLMILRIGGEAGRLPDALREAARDLRIKREAQSSFPQAIRFYLIALVLVLAGILWFIMTFIIPKFRKIFDDFKVKLPGPTKTLIILSDAFMHAAGGILMPLFCGTLLLVIILAVIGIPERRWPFRVFWGYFYRHSSPGVLRNLAIAAEADFPLERAFSLMARLHPRRVVGEKLLFVHNENMLGISPWDSLVEVQLIRSQDRSVLNAAEKAGNLPWALRELAETLQRRNIYKLKTRLEILRPMLLLGLGLIVGFVVVSTFFPLIALINELS